MNFEVEWIKFSAYFNSTIFGTRTRYLIKSFDRLYMNAINFKQCVK